MSPESDYSANTASIYQYILGFDPKNPESEKIRVSSSNLKMAIKKAYQAGKNEKLLHESGVDTELLFWQLMDSLPDHVYFKDLRSRFTCINQSQAQFLGLDDPNDAIGKSDFDYFEEENAAERFKGEQEIIQSGKGWLLREELDIQDDNRVRCIIASKQILKNEDGIPIGTFGISRNVTSRYLAEREIERQRKLLSTIIQILPCRIYVRDLEDRFLMVNDRYARAIGESDQSKLIGRRLAEFYSDANFERIHAEDQIIKSKGISIRNQIEFDTSVLAKKRWIVTSKVPLLSADQTVDGIVGMTYDITEQKEAEERAHSLGRELKQKNEQFEAELLVARQLQETLMSMGFDHERKFSKKGIRWNIDASYFYKPSHHLAGDFFDLIPISENKIGILVCDVMGHGVKAALVTMLLRGLILEMPDSLEFPGKVLTQLNNSLCSLAEDQEFPRFVTAVYMTIDLENGVARVANAGHPDPLWKTLDEDNKETFLPCPSKAPGPALGLIEDEIFEEHKFDFTELTELLFYTDGIIEQKDAVGNEFGIQKLEDILLNNKSVTLTKQIETIQSALRLTAGSKDFDDDICVVAVKLTPH